MTTCYLGLGSNLNDPVGQLEQAIEAIAQSTGCTLVATSPFYTSAPIGPQDQPDFVNAVIAIRTSLEPNELLALALKLELESGRKRARHWGERTLDIDILLYGNLQLNDAHLVVPHPRLSERRFVLQPLHDLAPELVLTNGQHIAEALADVQDQQLAPLDRSRGKPA